MNVLALLESSSAQVPSHRDTENIFEFWLRFSAHGAPFWHPKDQPLLEQKAKLVDTEILDFEKFVASRHFGDFRDQRLHLSLLPVPFLGNVRQADIIILLLNPGFGYADYWAETHSQVYRERLISNLKQNFDRVAFPFVCLDPEFCWHPGFGWWEKKFRDVISIIAERWFDRIYLNALRSVSNRIAAIELIPYHSRSFNAHALLNELASAIAAKQYVQNTLAPTAIRGEKLIIVTRQASSWGLSEESENICVYKGGHTRGASLSPNSEGGKAIIKRYETALPSVSACSL